MRNMNTQTVSTGNDGVSDRVNEYIKAAEESMNIDWFEIELETMAIKLGICINCLKKKLAKDLKKND